MSTHAVRTNALSTMPVEPAQDAAEIAALVGALTAFLEEKTLPPGETGIEPTTPLLEWGLLTSLMTTELVAFIQQQYEVFVPADQIVGANFRNVLALAHMVRALRLNGASSA